jgi:hypothetical protein
MLETTRVFMRGHLPAYHDAFEDIILMADAMPRIGDGRI